MKLKTLLLAALIIGVVFAIAWDIHLLFNWLLTFTGSKNEGGPWYGFWSGFAGSFLAPNMAIFGTAFLILRHHNCDHKGCWRIKTRVTKKGHKLCAVHIALPNEELNLPEIHPDHV